MVQARVIYWFRTDLRLHDSPALKAALDLDPAVLWPIFTWDPHYVYRAKCGVNRWQFLLDCQNDVSESIRKLNPKSKLFVLREAPQTLLPKIFKAWDVSHLVFETDTEPYARERDRTVTELAKRAGVQVITRYGRTLWDSDQVVAQNNGKPTMSITQLQAAGAKVGMIPRPIPAPTHLPDPGETPLNFDHARPVITPGQDLNGHHRDKDATYTTIAGPKADFAPETVAELGFAPATTPHRGGETVALRKLEHIMADEHYAATFRKPQTSPAAFEPQSTTLLSPYLHFGALSPRLLYWRAQDIVDRYKGKDVAKPPESLTGQMLFRDMYFAAQAGIGPAFTQELDNGYCRFIPWHLPSKVAPADGTGEDAISGEYHIDSAGAEEWFQRYKAGVTGFPWIDALMRQLRAEGWIHHLGRHSLASFLTRGGAYIHWERGADVFEELLLDHEPACNAGNWQWLSCTAFYHQYYKMYSPVAFGQKWDRRGDFVRHWVPELRHLDEKFIYEPWKANKAALAKAALTIAGKGLEDRAPGTYPEPMFDFAERRTFCMAAMKEAYQVNLYGNSSEVKDGTWKKLFAQEDDVGTRSDKAGGADDTGPKRRKAKEGPLDRLIKKAKVKAKE